MRTTERAGARAGRSFTLVELLVVVAIIGIIASLLLNALGGAMRKVRGIQCTSNLRQIGLASYTYADENNGVVMPSVLVEGNGADLVGWANYLANNTEVRQDAIFRCPEFAAQECYVPFEYDAAGHRAIPRCSYVMNTIAEGAWGAAAISTPAARSSGWGNNSQNPIKAQCVRDPSAKIYLLDALPRPPSYGSTLAWNSDLTGIVHWQETDHGPFPTTLAGSSYRDVGVHHNWGFNAIYGDNHVSWIRDGNSPPDQWVVRVR